MFRELLLWVSLSKEKSQWLYNERNATFVYIPWEKCHYLTRHALRVNNMMTSSNKNIFRVIGPLCGNSPHKGQWRTALMFSLICAWTNGWVKNWDAGDLRRHRTQNDAIVITKYPNSIWPNVDIWHHTCRLAYSRYWVAACRIQASSWTNDENRDISNISGTKSLNLIVFRLGLKFSLRYMLKPSVKWRRNCSWSSSDRRWSNYVWGINN